MMVVWPFAYRVTPRIRGRGGSRLSRGRRRLRSSRFNLREARADGPARRHHHLSRNARAAGRARACRRRSSKLALMRAEDMHRLVLPLSLRDRRHAVAVVRAARRWTMRALAARLPEPTTEIFVLHVGGVPAGYFELDAADTRETELCYFGLIPNFIGRGLGPFCCRRRSTAPGRARSSGFWVHTSTFDHPEGVARLSARRLHRVSAAAGVVRRPAVARHPAAPLPAPAAAAVAGGLAMRSGIGDAPKRREDQRFLTGHGALSRRSRLRRSGACGRAALAARACADPRIDTATARAVPGVLAVLTAAEAHADGLQPLRPSVEANTQTGEPFAFAPQPLLADGQGALCRRAGGADRRRDPRRRRWTPPSWWRSITRRCRR